MAVTWVGRNGRDHGQDRRDRDAAGHRGHDRDGKVDDGEDDEREERCAEDVHFVSARERGRPADRADGATTFDDDASGHGEVPRHDVQDYICHTVMMSSP